MGIVTSVSFRCISNRLAICIALCIGEGVLQGQSLPGSERNPFFFFSYALLSPLYLTLALAVHVLSMSFQLPGAYPLNATRAMSPRIFGQPSPDFCP
jgi:hypothetical protein